MDLLVGQTHLTEIARSQKWQMIGILRDDYAGDSCFCWHAALDQARLCRCLHNARLARPTCVLRAACDDDPELRGHDVQPFADVFANDVTLGATAAGDVWCYHFFNTRQMFGQDATTCTGF